MCSTRPPSDSVNVANRLTAQARARPDAVAVVEPLGYDRHGKRKYRRFTFRELDEDSDRISLGLHELGVTPGTRLALLVRPGVDFVSLVFGLFKAAAVAILIDRGMGRRNLVHCLEAAEPEGFVAIPAAHAVRVLLRRRFAKARRNVTVGRRWFWGGATLGQFRRGPHSGHRAVTTGRDDPAAIIFTSGSTGPAKGVLYTHGNFDAQVDEIRDFYRIEPGELDLPGFPLFGLFNCAMGVTAVIPDMDPSRPAEVDPRKIIEAVRDWRVTQAFGSPAIWNRVGRYCQEHSVRLETVRRVLSAGAPVPVDVLERMKEAIHPGGEVYTPYGATESLPVASISAGEVLGETAAATREGAGVCVGRKFPQIQWQVISAVDGPIADITQAEPLPEGEIGELIVRGPVVTRRYVVGEEDFNALAKIADGDGFWHRMGDVGYLDSRERFWFCGRKAHRVLTADGPMYSVCCEAIFNQHPAVFRSALVGIGPTDRQEPVVVLEPHADRFPQGESARRKLIAEIERLGQTSPLTARIEHFLLHRSLPVDVRHNAKISRERLARWAEVRLRVELAAGCPTRQQLTP